VAVELATCVQDDFRQSGEYREVERITKSLHDRLCQPARTAELEAANQPGNSSQLVQVVFTAIAMDLGFTSEKRGLFATYLTSGLRPDFFSR
jgi:hypothetical protein